MPRNLLWSGEICPVSGWNSGAAGGNQHATGMVPERKTHAEHRPDSLARCCILYVNDVWIGEEGRCTGYCHCACSPGRFHCLWYSTSIWSSSKALAVSTYSAANCVAAFACNPHCCAQGSLDLLRRLFWPSSGAVASGKVPGLYYREATSMVFAAVGKHLQGPHFGWVSFFWWWPLSMSLYTPAAKCASPVQEDENDNHTLAATSQVAQTLATPRLQAKLQTKDAQLRACRFQGFPGKWRQYRQLSSQEGLDLISLYTLLSLFELGTWPLSKFGNLIYHYTWRKHIWQELSHISKVIAK